MPTARINFSVLLAQLWPSLVLMFLLIGLSSLFLTRYCIKLFPRLGLVDNHTGGRHIHRHSVPRGGGLAMILPYCLGLLCFSLWSQRWGTFVLPLHSLRYFLPLLPLLLLGLVDDRFGVPAKWKLFSQLGIALLSWHCGIRFDTIGMISLPVWLSIIATLFWITGMINAFNFIDGVDGLAGGIAIISSLCLGGVMLIQGDASNVMQITCLAAACLGFLRYNLHPAKIFMGDTGSMFIGYILGCSGILTSTKQATVSAIVIPVLACGIPILDITLAIWRRFTYKLLHLEDCSISLMKPDRLHIHHRLLQYFQNNQPKTVNNIYFLAILLSLVAILCVFIPQHLPWLAFLTTLAAFSLVIHRVAVIELWNSTRLFYGKFALARTGIILNLLHPLWDLAIITLAFFLVSQGHRSQIVAMVQWIAPVFIVLLLSKTYQIFWNHAVIDDHFRILRILFFGFLLSFFYSQLLPQDALPAKSFLFALALSHFGIAAERLGLSYIRTLLIRYHNSSPLLTEKAANVLIYGVGSVAQLYLGRVMNSEQRAEKEKIIGFLDRDRVFKYGYCYGLMVLGDLYDLPRIWEEQKFQKIVLCKNKISGSEWQILQDFCQSHGVAIVSFTYSEQAIDTGSG